MGAVAADGTRAAMPCHEMNFLIKTALPTIASIGLLTLACSVHREFTRAAAEENGGASGRGQVGSPDEHASGGSGQTHASDNGASSGAAGEGSEEISSAGARGDEIADTANAPSSSAGMGNGGTSNGGTSNGGAGTGGISNGGAGTGGISNGGAGTGGGGTSNGGAGTGGGGSSSGGTGGGSSSGGDGGGSSNGGNGGGASCGVDFSTDPENCGRCGHSCLGGVCQAGTCQPIVLASGQLNPGAVVVAGPYVYWTRTGDTTTGQGGAVMKVAATGGTPVEVAANQNTARGLALDGSNMYWSSAVSGGAIQKLSVAGGTAAVVAGALNSPAIAVSPNWLYFQDCPTLNAWCVAVRRIPLSGGTSESVGAGTSIQGFLAVNSAYLYWVTTTTLNRVPLNGTTSTAIVTGQFNLNGIAVDESNLFWANLANGGTIMKANLDGTGAVQLATGPGAGNALAIDQDTVYWTENGIKGSKPSVLAMVSRAGGTSKQLFSIPRESGMCGSPKTDDKAIYWSVPGWESNTATGTIMKLAKP